MIKNSENKGKNKQVVGIIQKKYIFLRNGIDGDVEFEYKKKHCPNRQQAIDD